MTTYKCYHIELGLTKISKEEFEYHRTYYLHLITTNDFVDDPLKWIYADSGKRANSYLTCIGGMRTDIYY